ncbi:hypothetical protein KBI52_10965 [Microvirga sp. HBU67558]|nr:hypothetical protein [Microvirga sp. HBU67558]
MAVEFTSDGRGPLKAKGRYASTLVALVRAGEKGVQPAIDHPMPRWSHYVFWLRTHFGVVIETINEKHAGPYAGSHARYVLRSEVNVLNVGYAGDKGAANAA